MREMPEELNDNVILYGDPGAEIILLQMVDDYDLEEIGSEISYIDGHSGGRRYLLCACRASDWNRDLSPWEAPPVFGKEGFGGRAGETLSRLQEEVLPGIPGGTEGKKIVIGGYSLSGLFAMWAAHQTDIFSGVAAASPSVWFPGFAAYAREDRILADVVYLSLGDREEKTKNRVMASVGESIRSLAEHYPHTGVSACTLEWNEGGHFRDAGIRCGKAFAWVIDRV